MTVLDVDKYYDNIKKYYDNIKNEEIKYYKLAYKKYMDIMKEKKKSHIEIIENNNINYTVLSNNKVNVVITKQIYPFGLKTLTYNFIIKGFEDTDSQYESFCILETNTNVPLILLNNQLILSNNEESLKKYADNYNKELNKNKLLAAEKKKQDLEIKIQLKFDSKQQKDQYNLRNELINVKNKISKLSDSYSKEVYKFYENKKYKKELADTIDKIAYYKFMDIMKEKNEGTNEEKIDDGDLNMTITTTYSLKEPETVKFITKGKFDNETDAEKFTIKRLNEYKSLVKYENEYKYKDPYILFNFENVKEYKEYLKLKDSTNP
jgi:hypothetical protein